MWEKVGLGKGRVCGIAKRANGVSAVKPWKQVCGCVCVCKRDHKHDTQHTHAHKCESGCESEESVCVERVTGGVVWRVLSQRKFLSLSLSLKNAALGCSAVGPVGGEAAEKTHALKKHAQELRKAAAAAAAKTII